MSVMFRESRGRGSFPSTSSALTRSRVTAAGSIDALSMRVANCNWLILSALKSRRGNYRGICIPDEGGALGWPWE